MNHQKSSEVGSQDSLSKDELTLKAHLSSHLDTQAESLDFNVASKLSAARHRAMAGEQSGKSSLFGGMSWQLAAGGTFAAVLLAFLVNQLTLESETPLAPQVAVIESSAESMVATTATIIEDLHLLSATDDIDFYQSVEFLEWMEMNSG